MEELILPVPKKNNVCSGFHDFRPVTTVSVIAKIFKHYPIMRVCSNCNLCLHTTGDRCNKVLLVFKTVVEYYNNH